MATEIVGREGELTEAERAALREHGPVLDLGSGPAALLYLYVRLPDGQVLGVRGVLMAPTAGKADGGQGLPPPR
jgi:hypothetical protein